MSNWHDRLNGHSERIDIAEKAKSNLSQTQRYFLNRWTDCHYEICNTPSLDLLDKLEQDFVDSLKKKE